MSIQTTCPACGHVFQVKNEFAGIKAKCSSCGAVLRVPQASPDSVPPAPAAPSEAVPPVPHPAAPSAAPVASGATPLIQVDDKGMSTPSRIAGHARHGRRTGRNPNTAVLAVAAVAAVMLLGVIGVGALYLSGAIGGGQDVTQGEGAPAASAESLVQGGQSTKVDEGTAGRIPSDGSFERTGINDSFGALVQRISPDAYQTETSSGRIDVKIESAKIDRLPDGPQPDKQYLLVTIQLQNRGAEQLRYANWDGQSLLNLPVVLMDDSGRMYRQKLRSNSGGAGGWQDADSHFGSGAHPILVGDADFDAQVLEASEPVLVDFYADWCPPCRALAPTIDRLAGATAGKAKIVKVDCDKSPQVKRRYGVRGIPRLILFHNGEIVADNPGRSFGELLAAINRVAPGAGEPIAGDETLEPNSTVQQTLVFEAGQGEANFLRLELPADAIGGQGVLTLEIPWSMIAAGADDRVVSLGQH